MKFTCEINMDNDTYQDAPEWTLQDDLTDIGQKVCNGATEGIIYDVNGNTVGSWEIIID